MQKPFPVRAAAVPSCLAASVVAAAALALAGCGDSNEWDSVEQRERAFDAYACQRMVEEDPELVAEVVMNNLGQYMVELGDEMGDAALTAQLIEAGEAQPTCDETSEDYSEGLVRVWRAQLEANEGQDFTPQVAQDAGIEVD